MFPLFLLLICFCVSKRTLSQRWLWDQGLLLLFLQDIDLGWIWSKPKIKTFWLRIAQQKQMPSPKVECCSKHHPRASRCSAWSPCDHLCWLWDKSDGKQILSGAEMIGNEENLGQGWDNPALGSVQGRRKLRLDHEMNFLLMKWGWDRQWEPVSVGGKLAEKGVVRKTVSEG